MSDFGRGRWKAAFPDLAHFIETEVKPIVNDVGKSYVFALQESFELYGQEGVAHQLLYIANNLKRVKGSGIVRKGLENWNAKLA
jgi:hypothetical protein